MLQAGIIGCGGITERRHGPVLASLAGRVKLVALADLAEERVALMGQKLGFSPDHQYSDYETMLTNESLDLVHICTPHNLHEPQAIAAMQAGAHVLLEKPIATSIEEADRMIAAAQQTNRKLTISHNQIFSPASQTVTQQIRAGDIGNVFLVRSEGFGRTHVVGRGESQHWRTSPTAGGGGPLIDNGYHQVYRTVDWVGSRVKRVYARIGRHVHDISVEDMALLLIEHENGATTSLQTGWCAPAGAIGMDEIFGTAGQIRFAFRDENPVAVWQTAVGEWAYPTVQKEGRDELGFPVLVREFVKAIETDGPVPVTGEASRHALSVVLCAYESGKSGQPIDVSS
ncbi:Gfo/Idh/MocA family oxidoreductase [Chloroflexi bacterium TSY]|nr:Gfo/Idh/MocA family oxidoreductase [Chloroflexi bacterium TSY]